MVKKGQEQVSAQDSPHQGDKRDPQQPKVKHKGEGSRSQTRAHPRPGAAGRTDRNDLNNQEVYRG